MRISMFTVALIGMAPAMAQQPQPGPVRVGRPLPAVNGTVIRCPLPVPPSADQQAAQFEQLDGRQRFVVTSGAVSAPPHPPAYVGEQFRCSPQCREPPASPLACIVHWMSRCLALVSVVQLPAAESRGFSNPRPRVAR